MTLRELTQLAAHYPLVLGAICVLLPFAAWLCGAIHGKGKGGMPPWKYLYAVLVYLACVPGIFACLLTAYTLFFSRESLLDVNLLVYIAPMASMVFTLAFIGKNVSFEDVPGFDRLSGLMVMIGCSFAVALAVYKMRIWIFFGGSIEMLFGLAIAVFVLLKWGTYTLFRKQDEPKREVPNLKNKIT